MLIWIIICCMLLIFAGYLFLIKPDTKRKEWAKPYEEKGVAHRGLFDKSLGIPENSLAAFQRAVEKNYGVELDVQLTKDNRLVVFHDEDLFRMCGVKKKVRDCTWEELCQYSLQGTEEKIPLFTQVKEVFKEDTPVIIEVKPDGDYIGAVKTLMEELEGYRGIYVVESFHPLVLHWLKKHYPDVIRGQLASDLFRDKKKKYSWIKKVISSNMLLNFLGRPDFIAYNFKQASQISFRICHKLFAAKYAAWTIRSKEDWQKAKHYFTIMIFDSFIL